MMQLLIPKHGTLINEHPVLLADEMEGNMEVISTEDALNKVDTYNAGVEDEEAKTSDQSRAEEIVEFDTDEEEFLSYQKKI